MNAKNRNLKRKETYNKYKIPNLANYMKRQKNCVVIHTANGINHELTKLKACYDLQKQGHNFITEAQHKETGRIADIVDLDTGEEIEVVDTSLSQKAHADLIVKVFDFEQVIKNESS